MDRKIPYCEHYYNFEIDSIINREGNVVFGPNDLKCKLTINGINKTYSKQWIKYITLYNVLLPEWASDELFKMCFKEVSNVNCHLDPIVAYFNTPVVYPKNHNYRLLARYPRYVISKEGDIIDTVTDKNITIRKYKGNYVYATVYDPYRKKMFNTVVHRLVALAWVPNDDWYNNILVNHIDGDKGNCNADNLEWCTYSYNMSHAINHGLRNDNIGCWIRNVDTGDEWSFPSLTQAMEYIGRSRINLKHTPIHKHSLVKGTNGRFEVKFNPKDAWYFTTPPSNDYRNTGNVYKVIYTNDTLEQHYSIKSILKLINLHSAMPAKDALQLVVSRRNDIKRIDRISVGVIHSCVYEAYNPKTKAYYSADTTNKLAKLIGLGKSTVIKALSNLDPTRLYLGWQIRHKTNDPWPLPKETQPANIPNSYTVRNNVTGEVNTYRSLREIEAQTGISRHALSRKTKIYKDFVYGDYKIESIPSPNVI